MPGAASAVPENQGFVLSDMPPTAAQSRLALGIVLGLGVALALVVGPFGGMQLGEIHAFVAVYTTAMFVTDSITAILLFAQFSILRSRAILVIASGYLFTAFLIVPYVLAFPGVLAPDGVIGGLQTTAHLYLVWHCAFPLFVIGYALLKDEPPGRRYSPSEVWPAILRSIGLTVVAAAVVTILAVQGTAPLPRIMADRSRFVANWLSVVGAPIAVLCSVALGILWLRRRSILDLFLMVVLCAYLIEIPPHYFPSPARFSTGWYAVRVTSLISSTIVLIVLLYEITALYGSLLIAVREQRREREARLLTGDAVAASVAHEVRQPLTAMVTTADAGLRFLDRDTPNVGRAMQAFRNIVADGHRAGAVVANIRANFKPDVTGRTAFEIDELIREALALGRDDLHQHGIVVHTERERRLLPVTGNRVQLQQVMLNLITNAVDAMALREEPRVLTVASTSYAGGRVLVSVSDNGAGIRPEHSDRVFTPLFTTKSGGMGLGLSICRSIIEAHEGQLWFAANSPQGTVFQFTLPLTARSAPPVSPAPPPS